MEKPCIIKIEKIAPDGKVEYSLQARVTERLALECLDKAVEELRNPAVSVVFTFGPVTDR